MVTDDTDDWMTALLRSPIFQHLPPVNLQKIIMKLEAVDFKKGDVILDQGSEGDYYYHIKKGHCVLTRKSSPNAKEIKLHQLRTGDAFGEDALITGAPRDLTITALTDITVLRLDKQHFLSLIKEPTLKFVNAEAMAAAINQGAIVMDVRSPDEYERYHLPGSINQPFFTLRMMIKTLDREKTYVVVCNHGKTSEAAAFILLKNSIDAKILQDGMAAMIPEQEPESTSSRAELSTTAFSSAVEVSPHDITQPVDKTANDFRLIFFQHLEQLLDDFCMRIDHEFGVQLGKNREKIPKDHYIKLLEYLRSVRKDIKQHYLSKANSNYDKGFQKDTSNQQKQLDLSQASLLKDGAVAENHVIISIISQCEHLFFEDLTRLNKLLTIRQAIVGSQNPIFPGKLVQVMVEVVNLLKLNTDSRIALYKTFEAQVFSQMGFIYQALITFCEAKDPMQLRGIGEAKKEPAAVPVLVEQPSEAFVILQKKLELWRQAHFPSAYDSMPVSGNEFYQHFEIKHALQILQKFGDDLSEKKQPLKCRVLNKLEELSFDVKPKKISQNDQDSLDLVSLIFDEIDQDESLPDSVKAAVLQLEHPLSAAVLGRYSIFTNLANPIITLLDDVFAAGRFLNIGQEDDKLIQQHITSVVNKMTKESGFEFSAWTAEADTFANYWAEQQQRSQAAEQNAKQLMQNKHVLDSSRKIIATAIDNSMKDKLLPTTIVEFLRDVWSEVLLDDYTHRDELPEQWDKSVQAMDELILSVMTPADENERKQILKLLPGLIAQLRQGLKQISYDKAAQARFFKDLAVWHIILIDKKEAKKSEDELELSTTVNDGVIKVEAIVDEYSQQAQNLAEQTWVAFKLASVKQWAKLIWKDAGTMLFVGKNGAKMFELQVDELAGELRLGQVSIIKLDQKTITERVLSALMG